MPYLSLGGLFGALFLGWVAGMFTYQRSRRWCGRCGVTLTCPQCRGPGDRGTEANQAPEPA